MDGLRWGVGREAINYITVVFPCCYVYHHHESNDNIIGVEIPSSSSSSAFFLEHIIGGLTVLLLLLHLLLIARAHSHSGSRIGTPIARLLTHSSVVHCLSKPPPPPALFRLLFLCCCCYSPTSTHRLLLNSLRVVVGIAGAHSLSSSSGSTHTLIRGVAGCWLPVTDCCCRFYYYYYQIAPLWMMRRGGRRGEEDAEGRKDIFRKRNRMPPNLISFFHSGGENRMGHGMGDERRSNSSGNLTAGEGEMRKRTLFSFTFYSSF